jgi:N-acetylmuramoyl-L-alanine amidase
MRMPIAKKYSELYSDNCQSATTLSLVIRHVSLLLFLFLTSFFFSCGAITHNIGFGLSEREIEDLYKEAESSYNSILDGETDPSQENWDDVIKKFSKIVDDYPKNKFADDAKYNIGLCYIWANGLWKDSSQKSIKAFDYFTKRYPNSELIDKAYYWRAYAYALKGDLKRAIQEYERFGAKYPNSSLYSESLYQISECRTKLGIKIEYSDEYQPPKETKKKIEAKKIEKPEDNKQNIKPMDVKPYENQKPDQVKKEKATEIAKPSEIPPKKNSPSVIIPDSKPVSNNQEKKDNRSQITDIRFSSSLGVIRIVLDLSKPAKYRSGKLENPIRVYLDIEKSVLYLSKQISINDDIIKGVRASQFDENKVRIVIDLKSLKNYKVFSLDNPHRIVIDVYGRNENPSIANNTERKNQKEPKPIEQPKADKPNKDKPNENNTPTLIKQLGLKVRTIVIDSGHGGKDPGAISKFGLYEKDFVLDIAKRLRNLLKAKGVYDVYMTRDTDIFIPLEDRTGFANQNGADLFISIHINSSQSIDAKGIETYYLSLASDDEARMTAALENASAEKGIKELGLLLGRILKSAKIAESRAFANITQFYLCKKTGSYDRGVRKAPFIVLIGANAPSILVELGFVSNEHDVQLLKSDEYKDKLANALMNSVEDYIKTINSTG